MYHLANILAYFLIYLLILLNTAVRFTSEHCFGREWSGPMLTTWRRKSSNTTLNLPLPKLGPQRFSIQDCFSVRNSGS